VRTTLVKQVDPSNHESMADELGPTPQQLARHLQNLREAAGLTIDQLAERGGLSRDRVLMIESGTTDPGLEELTQYANGLGTPLSVIFRSWEQKLN
jgi:transcriptional regulator with XRE-family HTH domain